MSAEIKKCAVLGAGVGTIATAGYNAATGYKNKRVKKKKG